MFSIKGLTRYIQVRYFAKMRLLFITKLRKDIVEDLQNLSYQGFLKLDSGRIQNILIGEVSRLYNTMTNYFNCIQYSAMLITYLCLAFLSNYQFSIIIIILSGSSLLLYRRFFSKTKNASIQISEKGDYFNSYLIQSINHFKYLKATNYFKKYSVKLNNVINETEALNFKIGNYYAIIEGLKEPIAIIIICSIIFLQIHILNLPLQGIMVCLLLFYRSLIQFTLLQSGWQMFTQNIGSMNSIANISSELKKQKESNSISNSETSIKFIELKDIQINYSNNTILSKINLKIFANQTIAFVGKSGVGKTSLINVIMGLFPPSQGEVFINGTNLQKFDLNEYRNKIGYISQDVVIFNDSLFNNITFFDEPTTGNLVKFWKVVDMVSLTCFIQDLQEKENSILGDNGILISGGQKQRISIARELYKEPELLILDEATSSLDSETESVIKESISRLKGQTTILIIAHRLSTIKDADAIYLLNNKKIILSGDFETLIQESIMFRDMVKSQAF